MTAYRPVDHVADLIQHIQIQEPLSAATLKKQGPKNHIRNNIRRLKDIQSAKQTNKEAEKPKLPGARSNSSLKTNRTTPSNSDDSGNDSFQFQGRLPERRQPSSETLMIEGSICDKQDFKTTSKQFDGSKTNLRRSQVNSAASAPWHSSLQTSRQSSSESVQSAPPRRAGVVPKYLKARKQQWKEQEERDVEAKKLAEIPPGHTQLSEAERVQTLKLLNENHEKLLKELTSLPVGMDSLRLRSRKSDLEKQLRQIEEAVKVFSKTKVYVKSDT